MNLLAIDSGRLNLGWSYFQDGTLTLCGVSRLPKEGKLWPLGKVCEWHYAQLPKVAPDRVAVEELRLTRARDKTLVRAISVGNGLLELQAIAAFLAGRLGGTLTYYPHFQCAKAVTQARVEHILKPHELLLFRAVKGKKIDDVADSLAHGLRACGRL